MELVLVGQPYCGKSTLFNQVVGYRSLSTNTPGATAVHTHGTAELDGERLELVDLPGIYSLQCSDEAGDPTVDHILRAADDTVLVNVIDASVLSRSLELTIQLLELQRPMIVALNMGDEARRKGISIDLAALARALGVPVVETIAKEGTGVMELFRQALRTGRERLSPATLSAPPPVERALRSIESLLTDTSLPTGTNPRFAAIKLVERDPCVRRLLTPQLPAETVEAVEARLCDLETTAGLPAEYAMSAARHTMAFELFEAVAHVGGPPQRDIRRRLDELLMHPWLGIILLAGILAATFSLIFLIGNTLEPLFLGMFDRLGEWLALQLGSGSLLRAVVAGVVSGLAGGIGIVIPYLVPFFVVLALLEDSGYLPRIAYLIDNLMHKIGLHGMSVIPIIMGYGCSVPGVLATRILKSRRDKLITATLTTLIPCSARMTIIFGLIGFFLSMKAAVAVYLFDLLLVGLVGRILSSLMPEESPGLILEIPRTHLPSPRALAAKTWFRLKEFVVIAWPILIAGSVVLEVSDHFGWADPINRLLAPYTSGLLGFPAVVGTTLLFGILRKELALILLFTALGTSDVPSVMTDSQIFGYAFFVTFYVPCLATLAALAHELGWRAAISIAVVTLGVVSGLTVGIRLLGALFA